MDGNGYLHPLRSYQALAELDYHAAKWDWYFLAGGEYVGNWARPLPNGTLVGYGVYTANNTGCGTETLPLAANGFAPGALEAAPARPATSSRARLASGTNRTTGLRADCRWVCSTYITRGTWNGTNTYKSEPIAPSAIDNMVFTSFRYYLP